MKINSNNINFKGYKNVLACKADNPRGLVKFVSMQVDNEGQHDFDELKKVRESMGYTGEALNNNIVNCIYTETQHGDYIFLDDDLLYTEDELKKASKDLPEKEFKSLETLTKNAYQFFENLTKRIVKDDTLKYDVGFEKILKLNLKKVSEMLANDEYSTLKLIQDACTNKKKNIKIIKRLNAIMHKAMPSYLK